MKVLGHDDIADHHELIALPHAFEHRQEQIAPPRRSQPCLPAVTTTGNEMQISGAIVTLKTKRHCAIRIGSSEPPIL